MRTVPLLLAGVTFLAAGCKGVPAIGAAPGLLSPGLLVGPEAASQASATELPAKASVQLCLRTAQEYEKNGQVADAIRLYEKTRQSDPGTAAQSSRRLAVLYDKLGDFSKSTSEYEAILAAQPADADILNDYGYSLYSRGDWVGAEQVLARAVEANPNHKKALTNLGMSRAQLGKWDDAYQTFCRVVRPADAHCNLGFILGAQGKTDEAKEQYRMALDLDPGLRVAQAGLAQLEAPIQPARATRDQDKLEPGEAASRVPTFVELEARMAKQRAETPFVIPAPDLKVEAPK